MTISKDIGLFEKHTADEHTQALSNLLPNGRVVFESKDVLSSEIRKFISTFSASFETVEQSMIDTTRDHNLDFTQLIINEWESAVGIPDTCFPGTGTLEERRVHVLLKFAKMNPLTEQDFIDIALDLGFVITIEHPSAGAFLPYVVTTVPTASGVTPGSFPVGGDIFFQWVVKGVAINPGLLPYIVTTVPTAPGVIPSSFPQSGGSNLLQCIFELLKPSMTEIIFENA